MDGDMYVHPATQGNVARLREFMRDKATASGITNLFVIDGTLDAIPLPTDTADVLLTCRAIGWHLDEELVESLLASHAGGPAAQLTSARATTVAGDGCGPLGEVWIHASAVSPLVPFPTGYHSSGLSARPVGALGSK